MSGFKASQHAAVFGTSIKQTQSFGCNTFEFQEECHCVLVLLYLVFLVAASLQSSQSSPNEDGSCLRAVEFLFLLAWDWQIVVYKVFLCFGMFIH